jgi:hypothetical protein
VTAIRYQGALLRRRVLGFDESTDLALALLQVSPTAFTSRLKRIEGARIS